MNRDGAPLVLVCKGPIEALPPALSLAMLLSGLGPRVHLVCSTIEECNRASLQSLGVTVSDVGPHGFLPANAIRKVIYWARFHDAAWSAIGRISSQPMLWIASGDTALCLGPKLRRGRYVLQLNELYDKRLLYRRGLASYARSAGCVVVPEPNRAAIVRSWYQLDKTPTLLPNKPSFHPRARVELSQVQRTFLPLLSLSPAERVVLYQGHIGFDRNLLPVAQAISSLGEGWRFLLMGTDHGLLARLRRACPSLLHIPYVAPPAHLLVTAIARIGVLAYDFSSLNNIFCAPNKVWEYSGYGIPMLAQNLPGLTALFERFGAGRCVPFDGTSNIRQALAEVDSNYDRYHDASTALFESEDSPRTVAGILSMLEGRSTNDNREPLC